MDTRNLPRMISAAVIAISALPLIVFTLGIRLTGDGSTPANPLIDALAPHISSPRHTPWFVEGHLLHSFLTWLACGTAAVAALLAAARYRDGKNTFHAALAVACTVSALAYGWNLFATSSTDIAGAFEGGVDGLLAQWANNPNRIEVMREYLLWDYIAYNAKEMYESYDLAREVLREKLDKPNNG